MQTSLQHRLTRSSQDRLLGGVCGGLARYFAVDATAVRLIFVALALTGVGIFLYPVLWLITPRDQRAISTGSTEGSEHDGGPSIHPRQGARFHPITGEPLQSQGQTGSPGGQSMATPAPRGLGRRQQLFGVILVGLGGFILADMIVPWGASLFLPLLLIGGGLYCLRGSQRKIR